MKHQPGVPLVFHQLVNGALCSHIGRESQKNAKYPSSLMEDKTYSYTIYTSQLQAVLTYVHVLIFSYVLYNNHFV